jgi:hypothetical protein
MMSYYNEEDFVPGWKAYTSLATFMGNNFKTCNEEKYYAFEEDYPGHWHTEWTFQGLAKKH